MKRIYNLKVNGYVATGLVELDGKLLEVDVEFSVYNPDEDCTVGIQSVDAWDGSSYSNIESQVDLDDLADRIVQLGDMGLWSEDERGNQIDAAMDSMEDR